MRAPIYIVVAVLAGGQLGLGSALAQHDGPHRSDVDPQHTVPIASAESGVDSDDVTSMSVEISDSLPPQATPAALFAAWSEPPLANVSGYGGNRSPLRPGIPISPPQTAAEILRQELGPGGYARLIHALRNEQLAGSRLQDDRMDGSSASGENDQPRGFNPTLVNQGRSFFDDSCTLCHDAVRATSKLKNFSSWLGTVRRMAAKEDADIPSNQHVAIATYLASLNPNATPPDSSDAGVGAAATADVPSMTLNGTISTVWRGTDRVVENKGFFPDAWVGIEWRPPENPVSGRVMFCTSCHGANVGQGIEFVEAAATLDLIHLITGCTKDQRAGAAEAELKGGRFVVPFGAISARVHPGALRTVSLPLMFNMGRRVGPTGPLQPVINMPYADEGANIHLRTPLPFDLTTTFDVYAVNGLQNGGPSIFLMSRNYRDNNSNLAVGGRGTIGNDWVRLGGSIMQGELQADGLPLQNYRLGGGDLTFRWGDRLRGYYEYAIRDEDCFAGSECIAYGHVGELELKIWECPNGAFSKIELLGRYDTLEHRGILGNRSTERFTYGLNVTLRGGSLLTINHEHWIVDETTHENIAGVRWTAAF